MQNVWISSRTLYAFPLGKPTSRWFPDRAPAYASACFRTSAHSGWVSAGPEDMQMIGFGGHCQSSFQSGRVSFISPSCVIASGPPQHLKSIPLFHFSHSPVCVMALHPVSLFPLRTNTIITFSYVYLSAVDWSS